jgi:hypothetical protein
MGENALFQRCGLRQPVRHGYSACLPAAAYVDYAGRVTSYDIWDYLLSGHRVDADVEGAWCR